MKGENEMRENSEHKEMRSLYSEDNVAALKRKYLTDNMDNLQIIDVGSRNDRCGKKQFNAGGSGGLFWDWNEQIAEYDRG